MALRAAVWDNGTIVEAEYLDRLDSSIRRGWGTHFVGKNDTTNWFHFPITTPTRLHSSLHFVEKVYVFYKTPNVEGPIIDSVHVYDGPHRVKTFDNLGLTGDHSGAVDASNSWAISPRLLIRFGLGLSVKVVFPGLAVDTDPTFEILFTAAGADLWRFQWWLPWQS